MPRGYASDSDPACNEGRGSKGSNVFCGRECQILLELPSFFEAGDLCLSHLGVNLFVSRPVLVGALYGLLFRGASVGDEYIPGLFVRPYLFVVGDSRVLGTQETTLRQSKDAVLCPVWTSVSVPAQGGPTPAPMRLCNNGICTPRLLQQ